MSILKLRICLAIGAGVIAGAGLALLWQAAGLKAALGAYLIVWAHYFEKHLGLEQALSRRSRLRRIAKASADIPTIDDLEDAGWNCDQCPRADEVRSRKQECDFSLCLEEYKKSLNHGAKP